MKGKEIRRPEMKVKKEESENKSLLVISMFGGLVN